jgi:choline-glycine betaine transporter
MIPGIPASEMLGIIIIIIIGLLLLLSVLFRIAQWVQFTKEKKKHLRSE